MTLNPHAGASLGSELRYHGEEDAELRVHVNHVSVSEDKLFLLVLLTLQDDVDLLGGDRQDRQLDAVKLIKATPGSGLGQTCRDAQQIGGLVPVDPLVLV